MKGKEGLLKKKSKSVDAIKNILNYNNNNNANGNDDEPGKGRIARQENDGMALPEMVMAPWH